MLLSRLVRAMLTATAVVGLVASESRSTAAQGAAPTRYELAPAGNEARYRVREQLMGIDFPSDAIGKTSAITGAIVVDATGRVLADQSKISVDLTTLKSDSDRRDRIIQNNPLQTAQFPKVDLTVKELRGLRFPWPTTGQVTFELVGDLTLHGVTRPTVWQVTATAKDGALSGRALTALTFDAFGMAIPRGMSVLTVENDIKLEYDFHLIPKR